MSHTKCGEDWKDTFFCCLESWTCVNNDTLLAMKQRLQQWWLLSWPKIVVPSVLVGGIHHGYDEPPEPNSGSNTVKAFASLSTIIPTLLAHRLYYAPTVTLTEGAAAAIAATITGQSSSFPHSTQLPFSTPTTTVPTTPPLCTTTRTTHHTGQQQQQQQQQQRNYDFVVVGHGTAGRCAVSTLQRACPTAKIAVVDPLRCPTAPTSQSFPLQPTSATSAAAAAAAATAGHNVDYYAARATSLCTDEKTVQFVNSAAAAEATTTSGEGSDTSGAVVAALKYTHAVLIATGARGAPPPHYLVDGGVAVHCAGRLQH
jgi:hypothetical protein